MKIIKYSIYIIACLSVLILIESLLQMTGLPITVSDLTFTPGSIIIIYFIFQLIRKNKDEKYAYVPPESVSLLKLNGVVLAFIFMTALGAWCLWEGVHNPLKFYSGVKGSGHGYTLALVGMLTSIFGVIGFWLSVKSIYKKCFN